MENESRTFAEHVAGLRDSGNLPPWFELPGRYDGKHTVQFAFKTDFSEDWIAPGEEIGGSHGQLREFWQTNATEDGRPKVCEDTCGRFIHITSDGGYSTALAKPSEDDQVGESFLVDNTLSDPPLTLMYFRVAIERKPQKILTFDCNRSSPSLGVGLYMNDTQLKAVQDNGDKNIFVDAPEVDCEDFFDIVYVLNGPRFTVWIDNVFEMNDCDAPWAPYARPMPLGPSLNLWVTQADIRWSKLTVLQ